jgi:hypothetical protein
MADPEKKPDGNRVPVPPADEKTPVGYRAKRDAVISTRTGMLEVKAFQVYSDPIVVAQIQQAGVALEPVYED